ncbi:class I SAM-dependent methyltransferase [Dapis sp. BLCC M172]|uniref:class I SAM-dependent methyltransferase n=1 Tax=Dapis sp. BLCC M172 TaxID=2975281 RepID=UPI003CED5CF8
MQKNHCPLCHTNKFNYYKAGDDYILAKCSECDMVWDNNPPANPTAIYQEDYYNNDFPKGGYSNYFQGMKINSQTFRKRLLKAEKKLSGQGLLLDVGCALGDCLEQAKNLGWNNPQGLEVSEYAVNFAKSRGLSVSQGDLFNHDFEPNSFDLIMLQDMIEHTTDPIGQLTAAYQLLKPGGWIFITTPNVGGFWQKLLGSLWYHYKPTEHLTYFSLDTIKFALEKSGFSDVESKPTSNSMSLEYILNRMQYYQPTLFSFLLSISQLLNLHKLVFSLSIGELEAWGKKDN